MKLKRGQKLCKNCNNINGARSHICKHCNTPFTIASSSSVKHKKIKRKQKIFETISDWNSLSAGDKIKVIGRSGTYYINSDGEKMYMTDPGIYIVQSIDTNGLVVYGKDGGFGYIYMGIEEQSKDIPNMYRCAHKIIKVNTLARV